MSSSVIKIFYQSSQAIRLDFDLQELFPDNTSDDISSVVWSFKRTKRDADDAILLKTLADGVVKEDTLADNGEPRVRLSLSLTSIDWQALSNKTTYILAIGFKVTSQDLSANHVPLVSTQEEIIKLQVVESFLRA